MFLYDWNMSLISSGPCDIVGDISYEELRALAYDDAKQGKSLQFIVGQFALVICHLALYLSKRWLDELLYGIIDFWTHN